MKQTLLILVFCILGLVTSAQETEWKPIATTSEVTFESKFMECSDDQAYYALSLINNTDSVITVKYNIDMYWSANPLQAVSGDTQYQITLQPGETRQGGDCMTKQMMIWSRGTFADYHLIKFNITNINIE